jgi:RNA recognition motif-containing protein
MTGKFVNFNYEKSISVQNLESHLSHEDIEEFISRFARVSRIIVKKNKFASGNYALVEFFTAEAANSVLQELNGKSLGKNLLKVAKLQEKKNLFEHKQEFYSRVLENIENVLILAKTRIKDQYPEDPVQEKPIVKLGNVGVINKNLHAHDLCEYLEKKIVEAAPELRNKCKRMLKKLTLNNLHSLYNDEQVFQEFFLSLKSD